MTKIDQQWVDEHYSISIYSITLAKLTGYQATVCNLEGVILWTTGWHRSRLDAENEAYQIAIQNRGLKL